MSLTKKNCSIQSYSVSSNTVVINTTTGNPYKVNQQVTISNAAVTVLNGTHTINSTPTANQFTFVLTTADVSNTVTTGTITPVISDAELIAFDSVNSRFTNKKQSDVLGRLSAHSDVDVYDTTGSNNDAGKIARLDYDDNWSIKRPGILLVLISLLALLAIFTLVTLLIGLKILVIQVQIFIRQTQGQFLLHLMEMPLMTALAMIIIQ